MDIGSIAAVTQLAGQRPLLLAGYGFRFADVARFEQAIRAGTGATKKASAA